MRLTGIRHRVKDADRAADAKHPALDEQANGGGPSPHDLVDSHVRVETVPLHAFVLQQSQHGYRIAVRRLLR